MRLTPTHPLASRALARLQDESGIALVMALVIMLVLTITLTTTLYFTSASARHANNSNAGQKAYALAEAGVNNALAHLRDTSRYPSATKGGNPVGPLAGGPLVYGGGKVSWQGTFNADQWNLIGTGSVKNPAGGADVVRIATAKIAVKPVQPWANFGIYAGDPNAQCTTLAGGITVNVPVYVASCLSLSGNTGPYSAKIWEPNTPATVSVQVGKALTVNNGAPIGTVANPISWVSALSISGAGNVHADNTYTGLLQRPALPQPAVDPAAVYARANWFGASCTTGSQPFDDDNIRDNGKGNLSLFSSSLASYDCTAKDAVGNFVGRLAWDKTTKQMTIDGTIFVDGNLVVGTGDTMQYSGNGTIYVNGSVIHQGVICGPGSTFNPSTGICSMQWDLDAGNLLIVAVNSPHVADPAFSVSCACARLEANTWTVGDGDTTADFSSTGQAELGGSVIVEHGFAQIAGGGLLKASESLPAGSPTLYGLADTASDFG
jgi:hypothetical protein